MQNQNQLTCEKTPSVYVGRNGVRKKISMEVNHYVALLKTLKLHFVKSICHSFKEYIVLAELISLLKNHRSAVLLRQDAAYL